MARSFGAATLPLRRLLALARDLLQAHDLKSVLELVGPAFQDLLNPDEALLLVNLGDQEYVTAFDRRGLLQPAERESLLYRTALQSLAGQAPLTEPEVAGSALSGKISLLALPFPPIQSIGVLAALWHHGGKEARFASHGILLRHLCELTGAALGNVDFRLAQEERISARTEEVETANREHARELQRRDDIEREKDRIAVTDVLTGMLNRRGFFLQAEQGFKVARRQGTPSTVIFADIDGLKAVNDELGHDVGDHLIQAGARILRDSFRDSDVVARLGGDEFAAFTLDAGKPEAILARIQENIDRFHRSSSIPYRIAFSTGIVQCDPASDQQLADYLAMADREMYERKKAHR